VILPNLKLYLYGAAIAAVFASGWYVKGVFSDSKIERLEAAYANERTISAERAAIAEAKSREMEQTWQSRVDLAAAAGQAGIQTRDHRIAALNATNSKLQQRIAAIAASGGGSSDTATALANLRDQVGILRLVVGELDDFAGAAAKAADTLRDELDLCRNYVLALRQ
jgi:hypothetical protein